MRNAIVTPWLYNYIKQRGDAMNVTLRITIHGWWMAFEAPSGLMGKPESVDDFEAFVIDDVILYISKNVLENNLKNNILNIYIEGYGRYLMEVIN